MKSRNFRFAGYVRHLATILVSSGDSGQALCRLARIRTERPDLVCLPKVFHVVTLTGGFNNEILLTFHRNVTHVLRYRSSVSSPLPSHDAHSSQGSSLDIICHLGQQDSDDALNQMTTISQRHRRAQRADCWLDLTSLTRQTAAYLELLEQRLHAAKQHLAPHPFWCCETQLSRVASQIVTRGSTNVAVNKHHMLTNNLREAQDERDLS